MYKTQYSKDDAFRAVGYLTKVHDCLYQTAIKVIRFWEECTGKHYMAGVGYQEWIELFAYGHSLCDDDHFTLVVEVVDEHMQKEKRRYDIPWAALWNLEQYKRDWKNAYDLQIEQEKVERAKAEQQKERIERAEYERLKAKFDK